MNSHEPYKELTSRNVDNFWVCWTVNSIRGLTLLVKFGGEDNGGESHGLSYILEKVAFPSRADLTEGHWAPHGERGEDFTVTFFHFFGISYFAKYMQIIQYKKQAETSHIMSNTIRYKIYNEYLYFLNRSILSKSCIFTSPSVIRQKEWKTFLKSINLHLSCIMTWNNWYAPHLSNLMSILIKNLIKINHDLYILKQ